MIIPWGTDAPIYHRPIATIGVMIAVNRICFFRNLVYGAPATTSN